MKILTPFAVTDSILTSSNVPENDHAEWASGTAYTTGQKVIRASTHRIYEALQNSTGKTPESEPTFWLDTGATNRWRLFDKKIGTVTSKADSLEYTFTPGKITTGVALLELSAESVRVVVTDPVEGVVYDQTQILTAPLSSSDWHSYFFEPVTRRTYAIFEGLPSYRLGVITVTVAGLAGETVQCGVCLLGTVKEFAKGIRYGARAGIQDYSRKAVDDWGNLEIRERPFSKRAFWDVTVPNSSIDGLQRTLAALRATATLYIGSSLYEATVIYGFFIDFEISLPYPNHSECTIELEGLI